MVSRNIRNKANSYIYKEKRRHELNVVREYINAIETQSYTLKLLKHSNIIKAASSNDEESKNLLQQLTQKVELLPRNILELSKPMKCQSRYIGYKAIICLQDNILKQDSDNFEDIKSRHLKSYIKDYANKEVLGLLKEQERSLSVKLRLCEPNIEEAKIRESLKLKNEENKERNKGTIDIVYNDIDKIDGTRFDKSENFSIKTQRRRKKADKSEQKELLQKSKIKMNYYKQEIIENKDNYRCSFTILHTEKIKGSVIDKPMENTSSKYVIKDPKVVTLERVREWLRYLEGNNQ